MTEGKTSISKASSYQEIGEFWDTHDLADYWEQTHLVDFDIIEDIHPSKIYYHIETELSDQIRAIAKRKGVSGTTLLNSWIREKLRQRIHSPETAS